MASKPAPSNATASVPPIDSEPTLRHALDSCYAIEAGPDSSAAARDSARRAKPLTGRIVAFKGFSFFVPDGIAPPPPSSTSVDLSGWSACPGCRLHVAVQSDSGISLEQRIAARVAEQKRIDSVNADPKNIQEFDDMFGPPTPFIGRAGHGYEIDEGCGDCMSMTVLFARPPVLATIGYGFDDDVSMPWRHHCEMDVIARTFSFRE
jgi:hypothetical protein